MELARWLERIGVEHHGGALPGLAGVRAVAERLGVLPPAPTTIVVAGTNGKGSTTAFLEALALAGGRRVGTTTSPHLHVFNERIRINGRNAADAAIVAAFETVEAARASVPLSYFEFAVLAALTVIRRAEVDCAVLEVGLGGRLDAVNVADADVAVITSIGLDHQDYLGDTVEAIAAEKAGILRPGAPVVAGDLQPPRAVLDRAAQLSAPVYRAGSDFGCGDGALWLRTASGRQTFRHAPCAVAAANAATALQALSLAGLPHSQQTVDRAGATVRNPGRLEQAECDGQLWLLDVAHNPAGARFLAAQLRAQFPGQRFRAVVGCLAGKDVAGIVAALRPLVGEFAYVDTGGPRGRSGASQRAAVGDPGAFAGSLDEAMAYLAEACAACPGAAGGARQSGMLAVGSFDLIERMRNRLNLSSLGRPPSAVAAC